MALAFASGAYVDHGSAASLDNLCGNAGVGGSMSVWAWVYRTSDGNNQHIATKDSSFPSGWIVAATNDGGTEGRLQFFKPRGSSNASVISDAQAMPLNTWVFIAATWTSDVTNTTIKLYKGDLSTTVAELTQTAGSTVGSGTIDADASSNLYIGNLQRATTLPFLGRIARVGVHNQVLTLAQLQAIQFVGAPRVAGLAGCVLLGDYYGTGTQPDLSGNASNGAVTSATAADHVPLGSPFGADMAVMWAAPAGGGTQTIGMNTIASGLTLYQPSVTTGSVTVGMNTIAAGSTLYEPTVANAGGTQSVGMNTIASGAALHEPTVAPGAVTVAMNQIASGAALYEPTVAPGSVTVATNAISSGATLHQPTVTPGAVTVAMNAIASGATLYQPSVSVAIIPIAPEVLTSTLALYAPAVRLASSIGLFVLSDGMIVVYHLSDGLSAVVTISDGLAAQYTVSDAIP